MIKKVEWVQISFHARDHMGFRIAKDWDSIEEAIKGLNKLKDKMVVAEEKG